MNRRRFFQVLLAFLGSITFFSFLYALLKYLAAFPGVARSSGKLTVRKSEIPPNEAKTVVLNNVPVVIINRPDRGVIALSRVCTHLGCLIEYHRGRQQLVCPCHAGVYDLDGSVVSGPPPKPLTAIPLKIEGESIILG
jgi:cytochrome b6-f complex iron-sulfur subunit